MLVVQLVAMGSCAVFNEHHNGPTNCRRTVEEKTASRYRADTNTRDEQTVTEAAAEEAAQPSQPTLVFPAHSFGGCVLGEGKQTQRIRWDAG